MPSAMEFYTLIALGILLLAFEVFVTSFVIVWFALGFILVGFISLFYGFENILWQLILISVLSMFLLILFRKKALKRFSKSEKDISDNFFNEKGIGEFKLGQIFYKGTFWQIEPSFDIKNLSENEKVKVLKIENNLIYIEKQDKK